MALGMHGKFSRSVEEVTPGVERRFPMDIITVKSLMAASAGPRVWWNCTGCNAQGREEEGDCAVEHVLLLT
jgi:hypothetical protein